MPDQTLYTLWMEMDGDTPDPVTGQTCRGKNHNTASALEEMGAGRPADRSVSFVLGVGASRAEDLLRRLADDRVEIGDHMCLLGKAAGVRDIGPGRSALAHGQDIFDPCDTCKLLRTRPEHRRKLRDKCRSQTSN